MGTRNYLPARKTLVEIDSRPRLAFVATTEREMSTAYLHPLRAVPPARPGVDYRSTNSAYTDYRQRLEKCAIERKVRSDVDAILASSEWKNKFARELSGPMVYPIAAEYLAGLSGCPDRIIQALFEPVAIASAPFRFAFLFKAIGHDTARAVTFSDLRGMHSQSARCALAAMGEIDWNDSDRRARAIFLLRSVIGARRS